MQFAANNLSDVMSLLVSTGRIAPEQSLRALTGGVSALVAVVEDGDHEWVVKVPLSQLSVADEWIVGRDRGANEAAILEVLSGRLGPVRTPRLLFYDATNVMLGVEYIEPPFQNYKSELLEGRTHPELARSLGEALAVLHRIDPPANLSGPEPNRLFDALRLDPYYRTTAERRPELREPIATLITDTLNVKRRTLVHGDLSPKNILVTPTRPVLLDWEVIHVGDPSFDRGMMAAHYVLKSLFREATSAKDPIVHDARLFWDSYDGPADDAQSVRHLGGVIVARLYGKSPVEYLNDPVARERAYEIGAAALRGRVTSFDEVCELLDEE